MIPFAEARARLFALGTPRAPVPVPLAEAVGRAPATDVLAARAQPPFAASQMDGYALRAGAGPWRVIGEVAAGEAPGLALEPGQAARIFTGAPVPDGADCVLIQEDAQRDGAELRAAAGTAPKPGQNIRPACMDFAAGAVVARAGEPLSPARIGLLAAAGHGTVAVPPRPVVALVTTGNELQPPGAPLAAGQIHDICRPMLTALLAAMADVRDLGIARDTPEALAQAIAAARGADVLVTVGGASVGDHDLVAPALRQAGAEIDFWKVAIRPGKPTLAGRLGATVVLGLPGNPASAFVTAQLFLRPLVRLLSGWAEPGPHVRPARLGATLPANGPRRDHLRARYSQAEAELMVIADARQDSSLLSVLAAADALIVREPHAPPVAVGDLVETLDLHG
ncbi:MAG: molybdopterin molybdotransferase MoeA [Sphingomonadaceae bacterium]|nr:molybdopterin molybdotransferase MoeA [Sphingomonadaceae bacterium]